MQNPKGTPLFRGHLGFLHYGYYVNERPTLCVGGSFFEPSTRGTGPVRLIEDAALNESTGIVTPPPVSRPATTTQPGVHHSEPKLTVIEGLNYWTMNDVRELIRYRELFFHLTLRDIKLRYKQTIFGVGWTVFQPLATVLVFAVFLGASGKLSEGVTNVSYTLFLLCGVLPWTYFANSTTNAANSLVSNERLVTKTFFPRVLLPASNIAAATFDFFIALIILTVWMIADGPAPTIRILLAPFLIVLLSVFAFGLGTLLSALIATQRDFRYLLTFGMQLWMFATPCIYTPPAMLSPKTQMWLQLNPVYGIILNFRNSILGDEIQWVPLFVSVAFTLFILGFGLIYFRRVENTMADVI